MKSSEVCSLSSGSVVRTVALCVAPFVVIAMLVGVEHLWLQMNPDARMVGKSLPSFVRRCALLEFLALLWAWLNVLLVRRLVFAFRISNPILDSVVPLLVGTAYLCVTLCATAFVCLTHLV